MQLTADFVSFFSLLFFLLHLGKSVVAKGAILKGTVLSLDMLAVKVGEYPSRGHAETGGQEDKNGRRG